MGVRRRDSHRARVDDVPELAPRCDRAASAALARAVAWATAGAGPSVPPGHLVRAAQRHRLATAASGARVRLRSDLLAARPLAEGRGLRPAAPHPACRTERGRRAGLVEGMRGRLPHPREKGEPTPVRRRSTGGRRAVASHDLRRTRHPVQGHHDGGERQRRHPDTRPRRRHPARRRTAWRPRRRPEALLGDKGYDANPNRRELQRRRLLLHQSKRLAVRWERRTELHDAFVSLACCLICWRRLKKHNPGRELV